MEKLKVLVGRNPQCDYTIENPGQHGTVSGRHATISESDTPNSFLFEDHSTNGSYVNGQLIHNSSCLVNLSDHITLGKTYTLPLADIVKRYFASTKTTKKNSQPKPDSNQWNPMASADPIPDSNATRLLPQDNNATCLIPQDPHATRLIPQNNNGYSSPEPEVKVVEKVVEKEVEVVPTWYWGLLIAAVVVAFIIGFLINC
jgi:predicted component of type VI protein secretion system